MSESEETTRPPTPEEIDAVEAEAFPNRATPEHWESIGERLQEFCEDAGRDASVENLIDCLRLHWHELTDPAATIEVAKRNRLARLKTARREQIASGSAMDAEIDSLEEELRR